MKIIPITSILPKPKLCQPCQPIKPQVNNLYIRDRFIKEKHLERTK